MKKIILAAMMAGALLLLPKLSQAQQFSLPQYTSSQTTVMNGFIYLATPTVSNAMNCIQHLTAYATVGGAQFNVLSLGTTIYTISVSTGLPYDSQWGSQTALCGSPGQQMTIDESGTSGLYIISIEAFTSKGWGL